MNKMPKSELLSIDGIGPTSVSTLNKKGVHTKKDILNMTNEQVHSLSGRLFTIVSNLQNEQKAMEKQVEIEKRVKEDKRNKEVSALLYNINSHSWHHKHAQLPLGFEGEMLNGLIMEVILDTRHHFSTVFGYELENVDGTIETIHRPVSPQLLAMFNPYLGEFRISYHPEDEPVFKQFDTIISDTLCEVNMILSFSRQS